jgi:hypothetical protein
MGVSQRFWLFNGSPTIHYFHREEAKHACRRKYSGSVSAIRLSVARRDDHVARVGLRPTRQRLALGFMLFGKGDRHVTAGMGSLMARTCVSNVTEDEDFVGTWNARADVALGKGPDSSIRLSVARRDDHVA